MVNLDLSHAEMRLTHNRLVHADQPGASDRGRERAMKRYVELDQTRDGVICPSDRPEFSQRPVGVRWNRASRGQLNHDLAFETDPREVDIPDLGGVERRDSCCLVRVSAKRALMDEPLESGLCCRAGDAVLIGEPELGEPSRGKDLALEDASLQRLAQLVDERRGLQPKRHWVGGREE